MKIANMNIIKALPIYATGSCISETDVASLATYRQLGVLVTEHKKHGGKICLVPWSNISSVIYHHEDEAPKISEVAKKVK